LVNIHLFHDPSNLIASNSVIFEIFFILFWKFKFKITFIWQIKTPSIYSQNRKKALEYSLLKIEENRLDENELNAVFGDFNFRLDLKSLINVIF